jgi:hypothetical protein
MKANKDKMSVGQQLLEVVRRQRGLADDRHRHLAHQPDVLEVGEGVEAHLAIERRDGRHADVVDQDGVAVGARVLDQLGAEDAAGTGPVLNDHGLAHGLGHGRGEHACDRVRRSARGVGNDHRDGPRRIFLRRGGQREGEYRGGGEYLLDHAGLLESEPV